jgi:glutamate synthase domain-containing protein 1
VCGIVGLHLRDPALYPKLGSMLAGMLEQVAERGPDSAGVGIYGDPGLNPPGSGTVSVLDAGGDPHPVRAATSAVLGLPADSVSVVAIGEMLVVNAPVAVAALVEALRRAAPGALVIGRGAECTVLKGTGDPRELVGTFGLPARQGWQAIGHTRMATESDVTAAHCHPFAVGDDVCLVHNGSFSNHATVRRELQADGAVFDSDNDSEVAARLLTAEMHAGADLEKSLRLLGERLDGFYTLLVTTADSFAVVRDRVSCKPAIVAETPGWVAMASEYRALAHLPGIGDATVFEPAPEEVYVWSR